VRRFAIPLLIVIVFAVVAEYFVGWRSLVYPWRYLDSPSLLAVAIALLGVTYLIRALRLFRYFRFETGFGACLRLLVQHTLLINVLPMRAGEFAFPALMRRHFEMPMERSLPALLWLRALDFHALVWVALVVVGLAAGQSTAPVLLVLAGAWLSLPVLVFLGSQKLERLLPPHETGKPIQLARNLLAAVPASLGRLAEDWVLTAANWILKLAVFAWIVRVFSGESYTSSVAGAIGGELSTVLPVQGFAGIGTYEAGVVAAMRALKVTTSSALTGAVNLHLFVLGVSLLAALLSLLIRLPARRVPDIVHPAPDLGRLRVSSGRLATEKSRRLLEHLRRRASR